MTKPLALLEMPLHTRTGETIREWVAIQTATQARGQKATQVIFLREPTLDERDCVEACLVGNTRGGYLLQERLDKAWRYDGLCK